MTAFCSTHAFNLSIPAHFSHQLHQQSVRWIVSNHDTPLIRQLYSAPYCKLEVIAAPRSISAKASSRQPAAELIITNY